MAQRAYRERKETTISGLEKQVGFLKQTVTQMNQAFLEYNDKTVASGVLAWKPSLGEDLRSIMEQFVKLARNANAGTDPEEASSGPGTSSLRSPQSTGQSHSGSHDDTGDGSLKHTSITEPSPEPTKPLEPMSMLGYQVTYDAQPGSMMIENHGVPETTQAITRKEDASAWWTEPSPSHQQHNTESYGPSYTEDWRPAVDRSLQPVHTYSFQETTFARRLLRDSYEKVYFLLMNPKTPPDLIHRKFRYSLCFGNTKTITRNVKEILDRTAQEPLGNWDFPMLHVGGAGLHFPRDKDSRDIEPPQGWLSQRNVGPWPMHRAHTSTPVEDFPENVIKWSNLEGVWFDNNDVEMYLRTKGLYLDGSSSVAEIEVEETNPLTIAQPSTSSPNSSLSTVDTSEPHSPANLNGSVDFFSSSMDHLWQDPTATNAAMNGPSDLGFALLESSNFGQKAMEDSDQVAEGIVDAVLSARTVPRKRKIMIDVDKLLNSKRLPYLELHSWIRADLLI